MADFHVRTVIITMTGGAPWGFRIIGGVTKPLRISKIRRRSKAHQNGLQPGDILQSVNGINCANATHEYAMQLISRCMDSLTLQLGREMERVLVFHNDVADYEEPEEQMFREPERTHVAQVQIIPELVKAPLREQEQEEEEEEEEEEPDNLVLPASEDVTHVPVEKLLKEATPEPILPFDKKVYTNSSFFNDPSKNFPTLEEEKELAHRVAQALTDVRNKASRGASMFEKRRQRSAKWVTEDDEQQPQPQQQQQSDVSSHFADGVPKPFGLLPVPPPPPPAPGQPKNPQEFVEEMKKAPRTKHNALPPTKAFDIAAALHNNEGRGAQIFAKRRAKSEKWVVEQPEPDEPQPVQQPVRVFPQVQDPLVVARFGNPRPAQPQPFAQPQTRMQVRAPSTSTQTVLMQNRFSMIEGASARLVDTQTSLAVAKLPTLQTKTFNTQPKGWRPVA